MTEHLRETPIGSETVFQGKLLTICVDTVRLPDGRTATRDLVAHHGAVAIVVLPDPEHVMLVRQWRHAARSALLEIPAGGLAPGEAPEDCASRELMEECGFRPGKLTVLGSIFLAPGYSTELLHLFLAEDLVPERLPHDEDEKLDVEVYSWAEVADLMARGELCDAKTLSGLYLAQQMRCAR